MQRNPRPDSRHPIFHFIVILFLGAMLLGLLGDCGRRTGGDGKSAGEATAADSMATADSLAAGDSLALAAADSAKGKRGGFFQRLFKRDAADSEEDVDEAVPVEMARVSLRNVPAFLGATASLEPEKQIQIQAKAMGQIETIPVEEGDWIEAGALMTRLDGAAQSVALEEATVRAEALERDYERTRRLHEQQGMSDKELNDIRHRYEEAEAQLKLARLNLAHTRILAPFTGRVAERFVDLGQHVSLGTPLFSLVDPDPLLARIYLPEREASRIVPGQEVIVNLDSRADLRLTGEVLRIAPIVDRRTGTVKVTCQLRGQGERLRPGSFVRVQVQTDLHSDVLVVPKRALVPEGGETYVFKVMADSVIKESVQTGYSDDRFVEIISGLSLDERVVTVGQGSLKTGSKVRDLEAAAPALADTTSVEDGAS